MEDEKHNLFVRHTPPCTTFSNKANETFPALQDVRFFSKFVMQQTESNSTSNKPRLQTTRTENEQPRHQRPNALYANTTLITTMQKTTRQQQLLKQTNINKKEHYLENTWRIRHLQNLSTSEEQTTNSEQKSRLFECANLA